MINFDTANYFVDDATRARQVGDGVLDLMTVLLRLRRVKFIMTLIQP